MRVYIKKAGDRRKDVIKTYLKQQKVIKALIKEGLAKPEGLNHGVLKEVAAFLTHGFKVLKLVEALDAEGENVSLQLRRSELVWMYEKTVLIAEKLTEAALSNPLELKAQHLNQLNSISRKAFDVLHILQAMEVKAEEDQEREENAGITPEEEAMIREFDQIMEGGDLKNGSSKEDSWQIA